jgi:hypothetical protein
MFFQKYSYIRVFFKHELPLLIYLLESITKSIFPKTQQLK